MSWVGVGIAGVTTAANMEGQAQREKSQKTLAAETARFSPWTGLKPQAIQYANPAGALGSGVATGLGVHQGLSGQGAPSTGGASDPSATPGASMMAQENASIGNPKFGLNPWTQQTNPMAGKLFADPYDPQYALTNAQLTPGG